MNLFEIRHRENIYKLALDNTYIFRTPCLVCVYVLPLRFQCSVRLFFSYTAIEEISLIR